MEALQFWKRQTFVEDPGPVTALMRSLKQNSIRDSYTEKLELYLDWAQNCGLDGEHIVLSCIDLAQTLTDVPFFQAINAEKIMHWQKARQAALSVDRSPKIIPMKLDPLYFALILKKTKMYEGRAWNPESAHNYTDMRQGDTVRFSVDTRTENWSEASTAFGISSDFVMDGILENIYFAPLVHWMYQFTPCEADEFQPSIYGASELLQLQRAAVYYTFPDYTERIQENGFLGLEIFNPHLIEISQ